jgi:hypothetical protein
MIIRKAFLSAALLGTVLLLPTHGQAGWFTGCSGNEGTDCPRREYSALHYWFPTLWNVHARHHAPEVPMCAPDRAPGIPYSYKIRNFPCPAVEPAVLYKDN